MSGTYFHPIKRIFLNLSGGTVTGDTIFTQGVTADTLSVSSEPLTGNSEQNFLVRAADGTIKVRQLSSIVTQDLQSVMSIGSTSSTISDVFIESSGGTKITFKSDTASLIIDNAISATTISLGGDIIPQIDDSFDIGTSFKRFRSLNTVNGVAVEFTASTRIKTSQLELGNTIVTENNIILSGNTIDGGAW
jgi:hypothetical protein